MTMQSPSAAAEATSPRFLTTEQAAAYLAVKKPFIDRMVRERRLAVHKIGRWNRFTLPDLDAFALAGRLDAVER